MKKIYTLIIAIIVLQSAQAQFEKGSKWIAGSASIGGNIGKTENGVNNELKQKNIFINFSPSIIKFTSEKTFNTYFIGYGLSLSNSKDNGNYESNRHTFNIGFGKTSVAPLFGKVYSTLGYSIYGEYSIAQSEGIYTISLNNDKRTIYDYSANLNINLGLLYRVNERFTVTTTLNRFLYGSLFGSNSNTELTSSGMVVSRTSNLGFNSGFGLSGFNFGNLQFGLMYKLNSKK